MYQHPYELIKDQDGGNLILLHINHKQREPTLLGTELNSNYPCKRKINIFPACQLDGLETELASIKSGCMSERNTPPKDNKLNTGIPSQGSRQATAQ